MLFLMGMFDCTSFSPTNSYQGSNLLYFHQITTAQVNHFGTNVHICIYSKISKQLPSICYQDRYYMYMLYVCK